MSLGEMDLSEGIKENIVSNHVFLRETLRIKFASNTVHYMAF